MSKKVWNQSSAGSDIVEQFTVGNDRVLDVHLARYDVLGSLAHVKMLADVGLLKMDEYDALKNALRDIEAETQKPDFFIPEGFEDIHSYVEFLLVEKLGDVGKKVHTGRSRNDQVLVDMHLFLKEEINSTADLVESLFDRLLSLARSHEYDGMPGYTHMQVAMPSSFGLWFSAYAESLVDDITFLQAAYRIADQNPLGSAAGYGSSFPLDRNSTTELLKFRVPKINSIAAQLGRGKLEKSTAFALASLAGTIGKLAMDIVLYMGQDFGFVSFPDHLTTGSSIMPHKRNPDVFELVRAKCSRIQALPTEITLLTNNLPMGYHRDFQLLKDSLFQALMDMKSCLEITEYMLQHIVVKRNLLEPSKYDLLYTVEEVNRLVMEGVTFRDAYHEVARLVKSGDFKRNKQLDHTHLGSIGNPGFDEIQAKFDEERNRE